MLTLALRIGPNIVARAIHIFPAAREIYIYPVYIGRPTRIYRPTDPRAEPSPRGAIHSAQHIRKLFLSGTPSVPRPSTPFRRGIYRGIS